MNKFTKKLTVSVMLTTFLSMQAGFAYDIGLGDGLGGADFKGGNGGFKNITTDGTAATLDFVGDSHVQWNTLNVAGHETLNFNAVDGNKGITVLNTVQSGMSKIYGSINANDGISKLIISNPNGVLFDGAKFTAAGDVMLTTQPMTSSLVNGKMNLSNAKTDKEVGMVQIQNSNFTTGGSLNVLAPSVDVIGGKMTAANGVKFITANGQDYLATANKAPASAVRMEAVDIEGDVYVISDKGVVKTVTGGNIKGNLNIKSDDNVALNYVDNGSVLTVTGDVNATGNGTLMYARNTKVNGNLTMENGGGFLEVGNVQVGKDMNLTTTAKSENAAGYKHFTHVIGNNTVGGNVNIESKDNVHIGNYRMGTKEVEDNCCGTTVVNDYATSELLDGNLVVGGTLKAHAKDGHIMTTVNVTADKIDLKSDNLNVLTSENALLTANEYKFSSNGYIGSVKDYTKEDGTKITATEQIVNLMENYIPIPSDIKSHSYTNIAGGKITQLNAPANSEIYIASKGNLELTGANAHNINLTAPKSRIDITGNDVHAKNINVAGETDYLKVEFPSRDYTLNYTNIRDEKVTTLRPDEVVTYELTDGNNGYNRPTLKPGEKTTYLIGPDKDVVPPDEPITIPDEPSRQIAQWVPDDIMQAPVNTPVAFAADLDDDEDGIPIRKNVDGSVTVVRAMPVK